MSPSQLHTQISARGPSTPKPRTAAHAKAQSGEPAYDKQIIEVVERLQRRYPIEQISHVDLESRVRVFYDQFSAARIRTFVAVFVERLVRRSIEQTSGRARQIG